MFNFYSSHKLIKKLCFLCFLISISLNALSQSKGYAIEDVFSNLNENEKEINVICEDQYGFIWVGLPGSVLKYDGLNTRKYTTYLKDEETLPFGKILSITAYDENTLLIGSHMAGLIRYDFKTDKLYSIPLPFKNERLGASYINDIEVDAEGNIWASLYNGIVVLNKDFEIIIECETVNLTQHKSTGVFDLFVSSWGDVYCSARSSGVYRYDQESGVFDRIFAVAEDGNSTERYYRIDETASGTLLLGTLNSNVLEIDRNGVLLSTYKINPHSEKPESMEMWDVKVIGDELYFGGINAGLHTVPYGKPADVKNIPLPKNGNDKIPSSVTSVISDRYNNLWIANHRQGLYKLNKNTCFEHRFKGEPENWLRDKIINCIYEHDSVLWIGTDGGGMYYFDKKTDHFGILTVNDGLPSDVITDIEVYGNNMLYVAHWGGGMSVIDTKTLNVSAFKPNNATSFFPNLKGLRAINDTLWIATHGDGIYVYVEKTGEFLTRQNGNNGGYDLSKPLWGNFIFQDSKGFKWIGTNQGLYAFNGTQMLFYNSTDNGEKGLYDSHVTAMFEDGDGVLWVGTSSGLQFFTKERDSLIRINKDCMPYGVGSITYKDTNELYLSSTNGLFVCNKIDFSITAIKMKSGLSSTYFRDRSMLVSSDGTIFLGTDNGVSFLTESNGLCSDTVKPELFIHALTVLDEYDSVMFAENNFSHDLEFEIDYNHSNIDMHFATVGVPDIHNVDFSYKLEGIDKRFYKNTTQRIEYSRTPPGRYNLIIRIQYNDAVYDRNISISIHPPFWQTVWFYCLIGFVFIMLVYVISRYRIKQIEKQKNKLTSLVDEKTAELNEQNNELKLQGLELSHAHEEIADAYAELEGQSQELKETNTLLQKTNKNQQELVSVLAHDVRNSFHAVKGFTKMLVSEPEKLKSYLPIIDKSVDSSTLLLNNLLFWFRSHTDDDVLHLDSYELTEIIEECIEQNKASAEIKNVQILFSKKMLPMISVDKNSFQLVLRNLIHNAIKYSFKDACVEIETNVCFVRSVVELVVRDYGEGMSDDQLENYIKGNRLTSREGTAGEFGSGLGLALVQKYIKLNNAAVSLESVVGSGTTFTISLPFIKKSAKAQKTFIQPSEPTYNKSITQEMTKELSEACVMIVEDHVGFRKKLATYLGEYFSIIEAPNGRDALRLLKKQNPDLIITDYHMPFITGDVLVKRIKNNPDTSHIPVIMFSAIDEEEYAMKSLESGADGYVAKSDDMGKLAFKVANIIHTRRNLLNKLKTKNISVLDDKPKNDEEQLMNNVYQLLENNYANSSFGVEDLAEILAMDRSHLYRKIKSASSLAPVELLVNFRLEKAMELLQTQQYSVRDVAFLAGFNAATYFSTKFKKKYGKTPKEVVKDAVC